MPALVSWSLENLSSDSLASTLSSGDIEVICGDGREGHAPSAPYDAIHVGAAAPTIPQALIDQLKSPGRMLIPVGTSSQQIILVDKDGEGKVTQKSALDVVVSVQLRCPDLISVDTLFVTRALLIIHIPVF